MNRVLTWYWSPIGRTRTNNVVVITFHDATRVSYTEYSSGRDQKGEKYSYKHILKTSTIRGKLSLLTAKKIGWDQETEDYYQLDLDLKKREYIQAIFWVDLGQICAIPDRIIIILSNIWRLLNLTTR